MLFLPPSVGAYLCSGRLQKGVFVCARAIVSLPLEYGGLNTRCSLRKRG